MEIRVLQYFLAVAREQSISRAAEYLHLSQPTLSRQLKDMEDELGKQLFIRGSRRIVLTDEGMILRKRAEEIMKLVHKTEMEITQSDFSVRGDIYIGAGETDAMRLIARAVKKIQKSCPDLHYHISSGDLMDVTEQLDKGLIDFGILFDPVDMSKYEYIKFPIKDVWGVLMPSEDMLAKKECITLDDLKDKPILLSRQERESGVVTDWLKQTGNELNLVGTYSLLYNASLMAEEGVGYAVGIDRLINITGESKLSFRPFYPTLEATMNIVWKKYQVLSKGAEKFLNTLKEVFDEWEDSIR